MHFAPASVTRCSHGNMGLLRVVEVDLPTEIELVLLATGGHGLYGARSWLIRNSERLFKRIQNLEPFVRRLLVNCTF